MRAAPLPIPLQSQCWAPGDAWPLTNFFPSPHHVSPEAATKYNKSEHLTLRDRLARLNTHSIAKKTTRLSRLFMHEAGFVSKVRTCLSMASTRCPFPGCLPAAAAPSLAASGTFLPSPRWGEPSLANADTQWPVLPYEPLSHCQVT